MGFPTFTVANGTIDGINTSFSTPTPYIQKTLAVFRNGQLLRADYSDGWSEADPTVGTFTMDLAPKTGDSIQVFYLDTSTGVTQEVTFLEGSLIDISEIYGEIETTI